jgi:hypothetical protein
MAGPLFTIDFRDEEVLVQLKGLPQKVREAVKSKMETILATVREDIFQTLPGKYIDPKTIVSGVTDVGSTIVGFIEATDKPGLYYIFPNYAKYLIFIGARDGKKVAARMVRHPYPRGTPLVISKMAELKPWIEDQLEDTIIDVM